MKLNIWELKFYFRNYYFNNLIKDRNIKNIELKVLNDIKTNFISNETFILFLYLITFNNSKTYWDYNKDSNYKKLCDMYDLYMEWNLENYWERDLLEK